MPLVSSSGMVIQYSHGDQFSKVVIMVVFLAFFVNYVCLTSALHSNGRQKLFHYNGILATFIIPFPHLYLAVTAGEVQPAGFHV